MSNMATSLPTWSNKHTAQLKFAWEDLIWNRIRSQDPPQMCEKTCFKTSTAAHLVLSHLRTIGDRTVDDAVNMASASSTWTPQEPMPGSCLQISPASLPAEGAQLPPVGGSNVFCLSQLGWHFLWLLDHQDRFPDKSILAYSSSLYLNSWTCSHQSAKLLKFADDTILIREDNGRHCGNHHHLRLKVSHWKKARWCTCPHPPPTPSPSGFQRRWSTWTLRSDYDCPLPPWGKLFQTRTTKTTHTTRTVPFHLQMDNSTWPKTPHYWVLPPNRCYIKISSVSMNFKQPTAIFQHIPFCIDFLMIYYIFILIDL